MSLFASVWPQFSGSYANGQKTVTFLFITKIKTNHKVLTNIKN